MFDEAGLFQKAQDRLGLAAADLQSPLNADRRDDRVLGDKCPDCADLSKGRGVALREDFLVEGGQRMYSGSRMFSSRGAVGTTLPRVQSQSTNLPKYG